MRKELIGALIALVGSAASSQSTKTQTYCIPDGPCEQEEVATTPNPWWFPVASFVTEGAGWYDVHTQLVNISSVQADVNGVRTFRARMHLEELDKRHLQRTGDWLVEQTLQVDCKAHRWRELDYRSGSSITLQQMPVPLAASNLDWRPLSAGFVFNGLHGSAFAQVLC